MKLFAKLSHPDLVSVTIQVNGMVYYHPLISMERAIKNSDLYDGMIKKLGGSRGKPSGKALTKVYSKIGKIEVTQKDLYILRGNEWLNDNVVNAFATLADIFSGEHIHFFRRFS